MEFWKLLLAYGFFLASWVLAVGGQNLPPCSFPAIYNFGDSNSDTGGISAAFEPIKPPNGEAFFHKPAGRAADGRLVIDFIGEAAPDVWINSNRQHTGFRGQTRGLLLR